jgi:drug/metabolite transporter (DMT)-like permease
MKPRDFAALIALAALWGGSFLFMRIAAPALGPVVLAGARVLIAGVALLLYAAAIHRGTHLRTRWRSHLVMGALNAAVPYALISAAELHLTAGLAAILNATTPLFTALVAAVWIKDPLTLKKVTGLVLGILGVAVLMGWSPLPLDAVILLSAGASLLAAAFYGMAGVYAKRAFAGVPPLASATGQQLGAAALLLPVALPLAATTAPSMHLSLVIVLAVLGLALGCTSVAYLLYFHLISAVGPTSTLSVTLLVPVFGLLWSGLFLHEPVTGGTFAGLANILASVLLITGARLPSRVLRAKRTAAVAVVVPTQVARTILLDRPAASRTAACGTHSLDPAVNLGREDDQPSAASG